MACDGDIDKGELNLIKTLHKDKNLFGDIDLTNELNELLDSINNNGKTFFKDFFAMR